MTIDIHLKKEMLSRYISEEAQKESVERIKKLSTNDLIFWTYTSNNFEINLYDTLLQAYAINYRKELTANTTTFIKL